MSIPGGAAASRVAGKGDSAPSNPKKTPAKGRKRTAKEIPEHEEEDEEEGFGEGGKKGKFEEEDFDGIGVGVKEVVDGEA
jgi:hypothetical protein